MDADPNMIQQAQANFPQATFFQGDARKFTLPQPPVDVIFSNAALHWIPSADMDRTMACLAKSLKSGGRFVVELGGNGNVQKIVAALQQVLHDRHDVTFDCPWYFPTIADFTQHMDNNGIEAQSAVLYDRPTVLEDGDEGMNHWLRMFAGQFVGSYLDEATLVAVNDKLRHDLYNGQQWTADYRRLRVIGRKR
jgi:SAM-dependent methyltransferase